MMSFAKYCVIYKEFTPTIILNGSFDYFKVFLIRLEKKDSSAPRVFILNACMSSVVSSRGRLLHE
jgi:hypothetical protein